MPVLVLLRHAKSDYPAGVADHDRPLADRGRRDAPAAGRWLAATVGRPDLVLVSSAVRAQQTWAYAAAEFDEPPSARSESRIYEAGVDGLLSLLGDTEASVSSLVVVGHNPGLEMLARTLAGAGDHEAWERMRMKFPTSALAVLDLPSDWAHVRPGTASLTHFEVPRG